VGVLNHFRERKLVERFNFSLKQYRAISTRYDKLANPCLAAVAQVCGLLRLNRRQALVA
jgi:transposase